MIENTFAPENFLFLIALGLFLLIFFVQLLSVLFGFEPFAFLDSALPDVDLDLDAHPGFGDAPGFMDSVMSMLKLGRVPFVFTFILFLFLFSLIGLYGQLALAEAGIGRLHWFIASGATFLITLPLLRIGNGFLERILPKDETAAVSSDTFVGRMATIVIGTVTSDRPAEAKVVGPDGKAHYVHVVADHGGVSFPAGTSVLIVGRQGAGTFTVIENKNPLLEEI